MGEYGYVDWSWDLWREITGETRPTISGTQAGKPELAGVAEPGRSDEIRRILAVFLGEPPAAKPPLNPRTIREERLPGYTRRTLVYQSEPGEFVPAFLLIPHGIHGRVPAVLCPHQTVQAGKRSPAGLADDPSQHTALELAQRGYVTLTWDALCFGERHNMATGHYGEAIPFYRRRPRWSLMSKMIWDLSRGIDYLLTLDFVDPARIGSLGHSHGGYTTLFGMALDTRIAAGVSNCGFDTFRIDGNTFRWSRATALIPRLGFYISSPYINMGSYRATPDSEVVRTPFDLHEMAALAAPRPLLLSCSDQDAIFPNAGWSTRQALPLLEPLFGAHLASHFFRGGHGFPPAVRLNAYAWLDRWLRA